MLQNGDPLHSECSGVSEIDELFEFIQTKIQTAGGSQLPSNIEDLFASFARRAATLTPTEHNILKYYADGKGVSEVAEQACISINTVRRHNANIYPVTGWRNCCDPPKTASFRPVILHTGTPNRQGSRLGNKLLPCLFCLRACRTPHSPARVVGIFHKKILENQAQCTKQMMYFGKICRKYIIMQWIYAQRTATVQLKNFGIGKGEDGETGYL